MDSQALQLLQVFYFFPTLTYSVGIPDRILLLLLLLLIGNPKSKIMYNVNYVKYVLDIKDHTTRIAGE